MVTISWPVDKLEWPPSDLDRFCKVADYSRSGKIHRAIDASADRLMCRSQFVMPESTMRWLKWIIAVPYYLALFFAGLFWFDAFAPMAFLTSCSVTNRSDSAIVFTPVGTVGPEGTRCPLPLYQTFYPFFMKSRLGHFSVSPGSTYKFCYDMDDINFSEVVIKDGSGKVGQFVVNPTPTANQYIAPKVTHLTFNNTAQLSPVTPDTLQVFTHTAESTGLWKFYMISGSLLCIEVLRLRFAGHKNKEMPATE
ncbi:MAG: hypothetical protein R3C17_21325 [Planctomycetaceae bacterium]